MPRAKTRVASRQRRKKILHSTKGYFGKKKNALSTAKDAQWRSGVYAYRDRKRRKGNFRSLWIMRINAAVREHGLTYGQFISKLNKQGIEINRKVLAHLAMHEPAAFKQLIDSVNAKS
jgi:large subunit ribosomal protein L20